MRATKAECDAVGRDVNAHPDGKPWPTCCGTKGISACMCLMRKPRYNQSRFDQIMEICPTTPSDTAKKVLEGLLNTKKKGRFFCPHRTTKDGYHRECAGWAAKFTKNR